MEEGRRERGQDVDLLMCILSNSIHHYSHPHHPLAELPYSAAAWKLRPPKTEGQRTWADGLGFRYFLILQLGPNSSGNDCFFIG